jgi:hypothetical protein
MVMMFKIEALRGGNLMLTRFLVYKVGPDEFQCFMETRPAVGKPWNKNPLGQPFISALAAFQACSLYSARYWTLANQHHATAP